MKCIKKANETQNVGQTENSTAASMDHLGNETISDESESDDNSAHLIIPGYKASVPLNRFADVFNHSESINTEFLTEGLDKTIVTDISGDTGITG